MRLTQTMASAALIALTATVLPASPQAGGRVDVNASLGGGSLATADVNVDAGRIGADARVGASTTTTASIGTTTGTGMGSSVTARVGEGATVRADALDAVRARARVQGPKRLLKLCITVGAKGCDGASRSQQLALIDARLGSLSGQQLASACASVGGGCDAAPAGSGAGPAAPGTGVALRRTSSSAGKTTLAGAADDARDRDQRITCRSILANPARYETGLVKLCRKIGQ